MTPIDGVSTARDSDTVTVTTGRHGDGERPADATFSLTRTDSASERVLAEQVMASARFAGRPGGLRDAVPFLTDDVDRVVVETDEQVVNNGIGHNVDTRRYRFRGRPIRYLATQTRLLAVARGVVKVNGENMGRLRFELRLRPPEGRRIPSYPTGPHFEASHRRV